nr:divergent polysaccharide deacetylase family protein [Sulfitobacter algicola]
MDDGSTNVSSNMISGFSYPVTVAVDATRGNASDRASAYRRAGFEVAMMTNLPSDATPADIEVTFESYRAAVPQAVAVFEQGNNDFQNQTRLVTQLVQILDATGQGLVTVSSGLNSAQRVADREGLPAVSVFREISDTNSMAIRRTLDSAVFRAGRDGNVLLVAQMSPAVISALSEWSQTPRAETVAIAPLSSVLKAQ